MIDGTFSHWHYVSIDSTEQPQEIIEFLGLKSEAADLKAICGLFDYVHLELKSLNAKNKLVSSFSLVFTCFFS